MTDCKWNKGPPPHVGWWNASKSRNPAVWRWWDGRCWSEWCFPHGTIDYVAEAANTIDVSGLPLEWTDYWPANARVPRVKP